MRDTVLIVALLKHKHVGSEVGEAHFHSALEDHEKNDLDPDHDHLPKCDLRSRSDHDHDLTRKCDLQIMI